MAAVTVDGVNAGNVDLFSPKVEWQSHTRFCCFAKGRHEVKIRVAGQRNPRSTGNHVDIDMIVVE
jgi:hypothetical protein